MLVEAKCIAPAWDNKNLRGYLPGEVYEIDTESELACLTVIPVAYNEAGKPVRYTRDNDGNMKEIPVSKPAYVFDFDRNCGPGDKAHDYSCKKCNIKFKTLAESGRHSNMFHKHDDLIPDTEEVIVAQDGRKKKGRTFSCKTCNVVLPHLYALRVHNKSHQKIEMAETAVPA